MNAIWTDSVERPVFKALSHDAETDILIIGGGLTGILCAYMLEKAGADYMLLEADRICAGVTKNTTAKITCQHGLIYDTMIERFGVEYARLYYEAQAEALEEYRRLSLEIPCDFEVRDSFVYSLKDKKTIEKEWRALQKIGCPAVLSEELPLPFAIKAGVGIKNQAQFHPLKFAFGIAKGLRIYEKTKVKELCPDKVVTDGGTVKAKKIIVATHFPFINKHGSYFLKLYQHRSYVIAYENVPEMHGMFVDADENGMSFRSYKNLMFFGGGSHRTGKKGGNWDAISTFVKEKFPKAKEVKRWATQDCMSLDGIPYIGRYAKNTPSFFVATGYNKWGMTSSMTAAMLLSDVVQGQRNRYTHIFSPSRSMLRPQLAINAVEAMGGLLMPKAPRCPHLGCALTYNAQEHSWDCSCHGSRFNESGAVIDNPATDDLNL